MTDNIDTMSVDRKLLPERSDLENLFWYLMGVGATASVLGAAMFIGQAPRWWELLFVGGIILAGGVIRLVVS